MELKNKFVNFHNQIIKILQLNSKTGYYVFKNKSHLFNKRGGWNKRGGGAKVAKSLNVEDGIFWKKLVHNSNKRGVEGGKNLRNQ